MKRTTGLVAAWCVMTGLAAGMEAGVKTFSPSGSSGNWSTGSDWSPSGVPTQADRAVIPSNKTCTVDTDTAVADTIDVQGTLIIPPDSQLTLDNDNDNIQANPDNSVVDGLVLFTDDSNDPHDSELFFDENDHIVTGDGTIQGEWGGAIIRTEEVLTSRLDNSGIRGALSIAGVDGGSTFINEGIVCADANGLVLVITAANVDDHSTLSYAQWCATSGGTLRFDTAATTLQGDFVVECATLFCNAVVQTCGDFCFNGVWVTIGASDAFRYGSESCGTVGTPIIGVCSFFEITSTVGPASCP